MASLLFGSISTVADTSELQREAFNQAFAEHGLDWHWGRDEYVAMLGKSGGAARVEAYARERGETVDAAAVHRSKSEIFQKLLGGSGVEARPGVVDTIKGAREAGLKVGFVTTTSPANVTALLDALAPALTTADFDVIVDSDSVDTPKPDGAAYRYALAELGEQASEAVAIEDNEEGALAAQQAGVVCAAFPNENTRGGDFDRAALRVERLDLAELHGLRA